MRSVATLHCMPAHCTCTCASLCVWGGYLCRQHPSQSHQRSSSPPPPPPPHPPPLINQAIAAINEAVGDGDPDALVIALENDAAGVTVRARVYFVRVFFEDWGARGCYRISGVYVIFEKKEGATNRFSSVQRMLSDQAGGVYVIFAKRVVLCYRSHICCD